MRLVSIGECTIDSYRELQKEFVGGISLNFAVNAKRCGADSVSLISRIGTDHNARILKKLAEEGVDSSCVTVTQGNTARQEIIVADGERIFPPGGYDSGVRGPACIGAGAELHSNGSIGDVDERPDSPWIEYGSLEGIAEGRNVG